MPDFVGKKILLGVTGGIAAYKSAELARLLVKSGCDLQVVMTPAATAFISPMTFQAISGRAVRVELFDAAGEAAMGHIELARWADKVLIAPASADFMARLAHGMANDLLSTLCLATEAPVFLAPAMNKVMWGNAATRANTSLLEERGAVIWGPASGEQACGETGVGRMLEPQQLFDLLASQEGDEQFAGKKVLVTAGPTREALDPVRYLSNRSSGKMGFAIAAAFARAGAEVALVSGPVALPTPAGVQRIDVETAEEMLEATLRLAVDTDIFVSCAAVADYRPDTIAHQKMKKKQDELQLRLVKNPDILANVAGMKDGPFTVGFAAETERLLEHAKAKLQEKGLDMIAANLVGRDLGFDTDENALSIIWEGGQQELPMQNKETLAKELVVLVREVYRD